MMVVCESRSFTETFSETDQTTFRRMSDWLGRRPLHRASPTDGRSELVLVSGGPRDDRDGLDGDPRTGYGLQLAHRSGHPDKSTVREMFDSGASIVFYGQRQRDPGPDHEPVRVKGSESFVHPAQGIGCVRIPLWSVVWYVQSTTGEWATMRMFVSAAKYTKEEAVAYANSFETFVG
ncbi:MAG: hypothetical protein ACR2H3_02370 [Acidimicrobiales bacterium]